MGSAGAPVREGRRAAGDGLGREAGVASPLPPIGVVLGNATKASDDELSRRMRTDGLQRHRQGERVCLADYVRVVPDIGRRPCVLDAAISVSIGDGLVSRGERARRIEEELKRHPEFAGAIHLTTCLDRLLGPIHADSTDEPAAEEAGAPAEIGPLLDDGRPRYCVGEAIGRGATSTVHRAEDRLLSTESRPAWVAIKLFRGDRNGGVHGAGGDLILSEARKARSVEHPHVVRVLDLGRCDDRVYIVEEYIKGASLEAWMAESGRRGGLRARVELVRQVASAMDAVHGAGIVHGDLKPANILIAADGTGKIVDFGAAREIEAEHGSEGGSLGNRVQRAERRAAAGGTLAFMAPERFATEADASGPAPAADVYSLGAILFWVCTGVSPNGRSPLEAIARLSGARVGGAGLSGSAWLAATGGEAIPGDLRRIAQRALAFKPCDRYTSAGLLAADLESWIRRRPIAWQRPGAVRRGRLLVARRPISVAMALLCAVGLGVGAVSRVRAVESERIARESAYQAEIERTKLEASIAWKQKSAEQLGGLLAKFRAVKNSGVEAEVLTSLWLLEWVHGPTLLESPESLRLLWKSRIEVLESALGEMRREGRATTVEAELGVPSLALWYMRAGRAADAEALLRSSEEFWRSRAEAGDPWLEQLRIMRTAACVLRVIDSTAAGSGAPDASALEPVAEDLARLRAVEAEHLRSGRAGPIPELIREVLARAQGSGPAKPRAQKSGRAEKR